VGGVLSLGCAAARKPPFTLDANVAVSAQEPPASQAPVSWAFSGELPAPVDAVDEAAPTACRFAASDWGGPLRLRPELPAFVNVASVRSATVVIPMGDALRAARVSLEVLGVQLDALVAGGDLDIHLKKPQLLGGYLWIGADSVLHWSRASEGRVVFQAVLPERVSPTAALPPGEQACSALSVESVAGDGAMLRAALAGQRLIWTTHWQGGERVPLTRSPGRPPSAFLDTRAACVGDDAENECDEPELDEVLVLETRASFARIAGSFQTVVVVGWVPTAALQLPLEPHDSEELLSAPGEPWQDPAEPFGVGDPTHLREDGKTECAWNAPLAAETSGVMRRVGTLASGIPVRLGARRQGWREVTFEHPAFAFANDARAWVPERSLYPCQFP